MQTVMYMRANLKRAREMAKEYIHLQTVVFMRANLKMTR